MPANRVLAVTDVGLLWEVPFFRGESFLREVLKKRDLEIDFKVSTLRLLAEGEVFIILNFV